MSSCTVTCQTCLTQVGTPMVWHWLCEDCAQDCADTHRRSTGHTVNLAVTREISSDELTGTIRSAAILRHRRRFW